jgi:hypothetical protein
MLRDTILAVVVLLRIGTALLATVISAAAQATPALPRFEDYPAGHLFKGKPAQPKLDSPAARLYRTRIRDGVEKGWGVHDGGWGVHSESQGSERPGPNFAGYCVVIRWGCGSPCIQLAIVDAQTGNVYPPPITAKGSRFVLPLLTVGNRVSRPAEVDFRLDSRLMIVRATPIQSERHPSYEYYFVVEDNRWKLLLRVRLPDDARLAGDP